MDERLKSLLLLNSVGASDAASWKRFVASRSPAEVWLAPYEQIKKLGIREETHSRLLSNSNSGWAEREYEACLNSGIKIIACMDKNYPQNLNCLASPPLLLYWRGNTEAPPENGVSVVGTRRASPYGRKISEAIGAKCAELGVGLISGGALGIDGFAHAACCRVGGATYAIFGTGIDQYYPSSHRELFEEIPEKGALISEYPLGAKGEPWRFPRRNRIVAALGRKIVVVEAPLKSGAMITARQALEIGRELWAVPGRIDEEIAAGCNSLIYDGANPLISLEVFFDLVYGQSALFEDGGTAFKTVADWKKLSEQERLIINELRFRGERTVDNIASEVKMSAAEVMKIIAVLSAGNLIYSSGPGRFSAKI